MARYVLLLCSFLFSIPAHAERAVMERSTMSAGSFLIFPDLTKQFTAAVGGGDNLGNHIATMTLNMNGNNISNVGVLAINSYNGQVSLPGSSMFFTDGSSPWLGTSGSDFNFVIGDEKNVSFWKYPDPFTNVMHITSNGGIITSSDVVAHAYYGDGSHLTGITGGSGMTQAAIQSSTFTNTGSWTFNNSVTVSSLTVTGNASFNSATSTTTFSGWVDIGLQYVTKSATDNYIDCFCPTGKKVIGGSCSLIGAYQGANMYTDGSRYRCYYTAVTGISCVAACIRAK